MRRFPGLIPLVLLAMIVGGWVSPVPAAAEVPVKQDALHMAYAPERLVIPSIGIDAPIESVSVLPDGHMGVPKGFDRVGVLDRVRPGDSGNAVIAGHYDHYTGPAIFYKLKRLVQGDQIYITNKQGEIRAFTVQSVENFKVKDAPLARIFGPSEQRCLNLITCSGRFNRKTQQSSHRLVVFAALNGDQDL